MGMPGAETGKASIRPLHEAVARRKARFSNRKAWAPGVSVGG